MNLRRPLLSLSALLVACADPSGGDTSAGTSTGVATSDAPTTDSGVTTGSTGDDTTGSTGDGATSSTSTTTEETGEPTTDASTGDPPPPPSPEQFWLLEDVVFYDGYAATVDEPIPEGVIRHNNALVATPMTDEHLAKIQTTLRVGVIVGALCDNYDRIGAVNLALVPKGAATYVPAEVDRIEVARFITPFMDMNKDPKDGPLRVGRGPHRADPKRPGDPRRVRPLVRAERLRRALRRQRRDRRLRRSQRHAARVARPLHHQRAAGPGVQRAAAAGDQRGV
jgi:hypothetical protein